MDYIQVLKHFASLDWVEVDGPDSGVGVDHWFEAEAHAERLPPSTAYINVDQGFVVVQIDGDTVFSGFTAELDELVE